MNATDFISQSLDQSKSWVLPLIMDMQDAPTALPTPGGNHPHWILGHLTYSESLLIQKYMLGGEHPLGDWGEIFGAGHDVVADAAGYPSFEGVLNQFEKTRSETLEVLSSLNDADLDKPSAAPPEGSGEFFATYARCFTAVPLHYTFHGGQVADARRAIGRPPLMA